MKDGLMSVKADGHGGRKIGYLIGKARIRVVIVTTVRPIEMNERTQS